jgi:hypothetical protein
MKNIFKEKVCNNAFVELTYLTVLTIALVAISIIPTDKLTAH